MSECSRLSPSNLCLTRGSPLLYLGTQVVMKLTASVPIFWILSLMWSSGDSSRLLSSLNYALPSWQGGISPGTLVCLLILSACSDYQIEVGGGGRDEQGQQLLTFRKRKWLYLSVFTLMFSLVMGQLAFDLLLDAVQGLIGTVSPPHTLLSS